MKRTIRKGCFETNSSSMHSIVVTKETENSPLRDYTPLSQSQINEHYIRSDEIDFGRYPFQVLYTIVDKARYAIASAGVDQEKIQAIIDLVKDITGTTLVASKERVEEYRRVDTKEEVYWWNIEWVAISNDCEEPVLRTEINLPKNQRTQIEYREYDRWQGHIDHQSCGLLDRFLKDEGITIKDFLEKKKYVVIIDGDEYNEFDNVMNSGIYNFENIERKFPETRSFDEFLCGEENNEEDD